MVNNKSPKKIKVEKQIHLGKSDGPMLWKDIKHLQLEDDDEIRSEWVDDDNFDYHGYWHNEITRMVEETDEQFEKRQADNERMSRWAREQRYESYLKLKKEFEDGKQ
jgi:uncharacterized protein YydD (DUF2326 family)